MQKQLMSQYRNILRTYLHEGGEDQLYLANQLSKWLLAENVSPEEIVDFHVNALMGELNVPEPIRASFEVLTEVMIEYGNAFRENRSLRTKQRQMEAELEVAVALQQTFLPECLPSLPDVDFGVVSVPANQVSGDYYNVVEDCQTDSFSVAIADIVGKGIPAALCTSMIKFAMDHDLVSNMNPSHMLTYLNGAVERTLDPSMFVTMLYGKYDTARHRFCYSVAGHEPGFLYRAREQQFVDLEGKGMVLGMLPTAQFAEYEVELESGDMLILMTDGVTDRRVGDHYGQREELIPYLEEELGHSAQTMAENIYRRLLFLSNFKLLDDYTMIIIHRL